MSLVGLVFPELGVQKWCFLGKLPNVTGKVLPIHGNEPDYQGKHTPRNQ